MNTILHLETSNLYKHLVGAICQELGIRYRHCASAEEAFRILHQESISLLLTAMELKEGKSEDFILRINESPYRSIPIIVITGNDSFEDRKRMYELGIVDYIIKKQSQDDIKEHLKFYLTKPYSEVQLANVFFAVCDDSSMDRKIIERIFRINGITKVDYFASAEALLSEKKCYDVYLLDLVMRNLSGHQVIKQLREGGCQSVIIAISGLDSTKTISQVLNSGANDYITKPFSNDLFMARVRTNVRSYQLFLEVREKTKQLEKMALTDGLTGLSNHKHIFHILDTEIDRVARYGHDLSIVMMDLDRFKMMNDTFGHQFGDVILKKVSEIIRESIRTVDYAGRYGGEEFLIILPQTGRDLAWEIAERIRKRVAKVRAKKRDFSVTISGGVAQYSGETPNDYVKRADKLLYLAKESGRNNIQG
ncbi:MAG: diguanylate cyclase [Spirochaetota bacterium]